MMETRVSDMLDLRFRIAAAGCPTFYNNIVNYGYIQITCSNDISCMEKSFTSQPRQNRLCSHSVTHLVDIEVFLPEVKRPEREAGNHTYLY
jgi:hypothetical protein